MAVPTAIRRASLEKVDVQADPTAGRFWADKEQPCGLLSDYLVGAGEQQGRNGQAERLRGFEIDDQLELGWLLDR
jgi:hypothetical protein